MQTKGCKRFQIGL